MKAIRTALALAAILVLSSCFFAPGKFTSTLDLRRDGSFTFSYRGEIIFMDPDDKMSGSDDGLCYDAAEKVVTTRPTEADPPAKPDDDSATLMDDVEERPCTPEEKAERQRIAAQEKARNAEMAIALVGFDPTDPKSIAQFTAELERRKGWNSVRHRGGYVFDVDYRIGGRLDQDYVFPLFDRALFMNPFVAVMPSKQGTIEVRAPGFSGAATKMMGEGFGLPPRSEEPTQRMMGRLDGTFTITTDGEIRANNTAAGPSGGNQQKVLVWTVNPMQREVPRALIALR